MQGTYFDYNKLTDPIENSRHFTFWESDVCPPDEMYDPNSIFMLSLFLSTPHESKRDKMVKFYEASKTILEGKEDIVYVKGNVKDSGIPSIGKVRFISEIEFYVMNCDTEYSLDILKEIMRHFKILCGSFKPMALIDINIDAVTFSNFTHIIDLVEVFK